ncbi:MAG: NADH-quinone oxidoreductase subunit L [Chloroflexi bacterium]|nr:NADH-quinone oxidoreductase subunit L [Chloroflexota bacterium]
MPESAAWVVLGLPLASFLLIALVIRPFFNRYARWAGYVSIAAIAGSFILSLWSLSSTTGLYKALGWPSHSWVKAGPLDFQVGILMDGLTAIMMVVVSGVSLLIQIYSQGYMHGDRGYARYFAYMSLFTASMLGLVMSSNILMMYMFWELVGLCSYLLIGFWFHRPAAAAAAKKAFVVTRLGDFGFLLAILYLFSHQGLFAEKGLNSLLISDILAAAQGGLLGATAVTWLGIGIFAGAAGKSAQFPLHVWLPDAMEGPTPVSALIHAATMVAAGVFLVARMFPLFEETSAVLKLVALVGGGTAVMAATMGMVMFDIKRVIAYSTISQLGYMMLAIGVGAPVVAIFHLFNHAFFKALLFLGAGSVNHATGTFDMRYMGGLRRSMPLTYLTFLLAALSLAGIFPLSGFWSKDEVLAVALGRGGVVGTLVFVLAVAGVFMTAFYIFRALFMTFEGNFRGGVAAEQAGHPLLQAEVLSPQPASHPPGSASSSAERHVHLAESPLVMVLPMVVLAGLGVVSGFIANSPVALRNVPGHWVSRLLSPSFALAEIEKVPFNWPVALGSTALALAGIGLAYLMYGVRRLEPQRVVRRVGPVYRTIYHKYYIDDLYEGVVIRNLLYRGVCGVLDWFDRAVVDGIAEVVGWFGRNVGKAIARLQTGQVQAYGIGMSAGVAAIVLAYLLWGGG